MGNFVGREQVPSDYLVRLTPLLRTLQSRATRAALVHLLRQLRLNDNMAEELRPFLERLEKLEAWSTQRMNEASRHAQ